MRPLLDGARILALEQYGAGPYGSMLMAELGAEVIKIESAALGGDVARNVGPHLLGKDDSQFFQTFSRSKKSVTLEIKSASGRAAFERLVASADAVVNNLRGTQPAKLKIAFNDLKGIKPAIVCGHLSAYGRDNPRASWPGYDYLMQAEAGFMRLTGEPDAPPTRFGLSVVDFMAGMQLALGCVAAIMKARETGIGCDIDVSLFDVAVHQLTYPAVWAMNAGQVAERLPRGAHPSIAPSQTVKTRDGWGLLMCQTQKFWALFCELSGRLSLLDDPRFHSSAARREHLAELTAEIDGIMQEKTNEEWMALLAGKVPFAPVRSLEEALNNPFLRATGMRDAVAHEQAQGGALHMLAAPIKVNGQRAPGRRAPKLGEHNEDFLGSPNRNG